MKILPILIALTSILVTSGCSQLPKGAQRVAVSYGTHRFIDQDSERAAAVIDHIDSIRSRTGYTRTLTLAELETWIRQEIRWDRLGPGEGELLSSLIAEVSASLQRRAREEQLLPDEVEVRVRTILGWIEDAAKTYL